MSVITGQSDLSDGYLTGTGEKRRLDISNTTDS